MTDSIQKDSHSESTWIRLELIPLPDSPLQARLVYWNPDTSELLGDGVDDILAMVAQAQQAGHLSNRHLSHFEITQPLQKPSELAAILAQHFWVVPEPVEQPGLVVSDSKTALSDTKH